jgi:hypothetical protein
MTPEAKVKARVHSRLKAAGAYSVNYIGGNFANNGTPDILSCLNGRFFGIEVKAGTNKPTALQIKALAAIDAAGGVALVINESNLDTLEEALHHASKGLTTRSNYRLFERPCADPDASGVAPPKVRRSQAQSPRTPQEPCLGDT